MKLGRRARPHGGEVHVDIPKNKKNMSNVVDHLPDQSNKLRRPFGANAASQQSYRSAELHPKWGR